MKEFVLVSYPRSGANWLAYILDALWSIETKGLLEDYTTPRFFRRAITDKIVKRCHAHRIFEEPLIKNSDNLILLVRDPIEAIISHLRKSNVPISLESILDQLRGEPPFKEGHTDWIYLFKLFDSYEGNKILLYYEDLLDCSESFLLKVSNFLKENKDDISDFLKDIDRHRANSISYYSVLGKAQTAIFKDKFYYRKFIDDDSIEWIRNYIGQREDLLKYTQRYL